MKKGIAENPRSDSSNDLFVIAGEPYIIGKWVSFSSEGRNFVQYNESKGIDNALIHIGEVFATDIKFNDKLQMDIHQYRLPCCSFT